MFSFLFRESCQEKVIFLISLKIYYFNGFFRCVCSGIIGH